jgi:hypothetical protein
MKRTLIVICLLVSLAVAHQGLNSGIIYLMIAPLAIIGIVGYRWYRGGGAEPGHDQTI